MSKCQKRLRFFPLLTIVLKIYIFSFLFFFLFVFCTIPSFLDKDEQFLQIATNQVLGERRSWHSEKALSIKNWFRTNVYLHKKWPIFKSESVLAFASSAYGQLMYGISFQMKWKMPVQSIILKICTLIIVKPIQSNDLNVN